MWNDSWLSEGFTNGFTTYHYSTRSIDGSYVDGVSITYGTPRKHIWTYGIGCTNIQPNSPYCPCSQYPGQLPPF